MDTATRELFQNVVQTQPEREGDDGGRPLSGSVLIRVIRV